MQPDLDSRRSDPSFILTLNGGSSSLKFALFERGEPPKRVMGGRVERIGLSNPKLVLADAAGGRKDERQVVAPDQKTAAGLVIDWLEQSAGFASVAAVGHRVVHGGSRFYRPEFVTQELIDELRVISAYDPDHLPAEIELIEAFRQRDPRLPQVACFDTAFHHDLPRVAQIVPIPRRFEALGVRRYGFHGLSYAFLMEELARVAGPEAAQGRVILAHLGSGASMAAVRDGRCIDTTMGFTPTAGLVMGTRTGDIDPGLVWFLARAEGITPEQFHSLVNHDSGLLGVSETSADVRDLLARQSTDVRAAEALELFCYQAKKWIGALSAALGGLDTLVFSGGIGENAPELRARICAGLEHLGIHLDEKPNAAGLAVISTNTGPTTVRLIRTDEELMIAKSTAFVITHRPTSD